MDDVRSATESLLADKPSLEADLEAVLDVDADADSWTFDDVPLDSGTFGELVSRGVVEKDDDGDYRVADRSAVRAALDGEEAVREDERSEVSVPSFSLPSVDRNAALALAGALLFVVLMRSFSVPSVFRGDAVVLSSNDPYYYRYLVEQLLAQSSDPTNVRVLSDIQLRARKGEPLLIGVLWFVSALLGGGQYTTGAVLAIYPVISAIVVGALLYLLTLRLSDDRWVAIAAVLMLAVIPDHALRTAVGFADHHAFDYPWLLLTAYGLVVATDSPDIRAWSGWAAVPCLAVGITGQVLAWEAGPLLILPVGVYVAGSALAIVAAGGRPLRDHAPILLGTGLAAGLVWMVHSTLDWHTDLAASTPALLFAGVFTVTLLAEMFTRAGLSARAYALAEAVGGAVVVAGAFAVLPDLESTLSERLDFLFNTQGIAESQPLLQGDLGLIVAPIFWFGFLLFLALPYLGWTTWRTARTGGRRWLVPCIYAWFFLILALIQVRFSGELGAFVALFAGLGFVHLASIVDITDSAPDVLTDSGRTLSGRMPVDRRPGLALPDTAALRYLVVLFVLVAGVGMLFAPLKIDLTTIDDTQYETVQAIENHAAEHEQEYPENYVFSQWDRNRMYNYFVNGKSESYGFAQSNYDQFLSETDSEAAFDRLGNRRGYVVTENEWVPEEMNDSSVGVRLHEYWGSATDGSDGLGRYRAIHASSGGSTKVFEVVSGAVIEGNATPGETVVVTTSASISGTDFTYERMATATEQGRYRVRVAYPGTYTVQGQQVSVSEVAVDRGTTVRVNTTAANSSPQSFPGL
ncbi:STT3 domain-containing protein [Haloarchaeobius iranensis]|uniref:Dolichyl-diphosphooligosaccharide--protein glycosyltransferase n=1 Tax=Haloarchaeobius iranensis TaxID=996166 RepID=A0A1H0C4E5_9EURY|nr:STT3 domain-containing protein [Haloarchaeobius iranensis]SDN52730.1 dolichyl-diphosphooligosaccharide--protein glycosyltransferase [Haloarchaeobius iranensis]